MEGNPEADGSDHTPPDEMRAWLIQELKDCAKALELRTREATEFVTTYLSGGMTPDEAAECQWRYRHRWGEALPGVRAYPNTTDKQILEKIDKVRGPS